jgi:hypothetical protein
MTANKRIVILTEHADRVPRRQPRARLLVILALALLPLILGACDGGAPQDEVVLPETGVIMLRPRWAVVNEPYVPALLAPGAADQVSGQLRLGEVVEIVEIGTTQFRDDGTEQPWFLVEAAESSGWLVNTSVTVFGSRNQAENAARAMLGGEVGEE